MHVRIWRKTYPFSRLFGRSRDRSPYFGITCLDAHLSMFLTLILMGRSDCRLFPGNRPATPCLVQCIFHVLGHICVVLSENGEASRHRRTRVYMTPICYLYFRVTCIYCFYSQTRCLEMHNDLNMLTLQDRRQLRVNAQTCKCLNALAPDYLFVFEYLSIHHGVNTRVVAYRDLVVATSRIHAG